MRFKTDENLHSEVADALLRHGHDALTVWDEDMQGSNDRRIIETCQVEKRALLTLDVGFADIRSYPPVEYSGIVVLRLNDQSRKHVLGVLPRLLELMRDEPLEGRLWIVDETTVRIRASEAYPEKA